MNSINYQNVYADGFQGSEYFSPLDAELNLDTRFPLACRKMKIGGHWHRPPVGMKASEASHRLVHFKCFRLAWLEPNT